MAIIEVEHVTKEYRLGQLSSLKQGALNTLRRLTGKRPAERKPFKALDDVDFSIEQGEVVGIIGHNGAGKSTLLKLLAGISKPTKGRVSVQGRIAPLIEVGAGFIGDFTGRENVYLNGSILGLSRKEIDKKFDEIVAFAEMEEFIDTPVKRYSSGMQVKLAFAVATSIEAEILIVDEVLAVGDLAFQRKCFDRMEDLIKRQGKTVLLVSHNIRQVERLCKRAMLLESGKLVIDGDPKYVCNTFYQNSEAQVCASRKSKTDGSQNQIGQSSGELLLEKITLLDSNSNPTDSIETGSNIRVQLTFLALEELIKPAFGVGIQTPDFVYLTHQESFEDIQVERILKGQRFQIECRFENPPLLPGVYTLRLGVGAGEIMHTVYYGEDIFPFQIKAEKLSSDEGMRNGIIATMATWSLEIKSLPHSNNFSTDDQQIQPILV
ncbi:ABC transporter ATP-binding protein [Methylocaldum sp.]|uniref:ABC transporter ATP-binding protein n=1 Tax=Methylocaldum sp. TaxID=1969727 RepID=UPI002D2A1C84|nr:ABC transporter ATP-binding protein [Methylocaldum sp.]HYE37875.1 ABC transporter ATP-binding protein [Methylocaldum sp.]